ncbi:MAG: Gfo/Idh/MocA family oxidoreductase, partial [Verrucomicrobiae bacterium]|nr:Gfo/Idh/MocA family oxidoreductase [Verrucomicrobiae bacterium]
MQQIKRREFLKGSVGAATVFCTLPGVIYASPNNRIVIGVMGLGGRGTGLAGMLAARSDVQIKYLCDPDARKHAQALRAVQERAPERGPEQRPPQCVQDFRRMLDDKEVDAIINATPDHWHCLGTVMACQAGKHVYVEKPLAHGVWEGRKMIEAARKYNRVVTVGTQTRSAPYAHAARDLVRSGKLGEVRLVRVYNLMQHPPQRLGPEQPVPKEFDYDMWCGPAPMLPYVAGRYWLNMAEFSCGPIPGDAIHQLDLARFVMGDPPPPLSVSHHGGIFVLQDGRDTPDTQYAIFEYEKFTLIFQGALWTPYMRKIPISIRESDEFPDWQFCATKIEILGTKAYMYLGRHGGGWQVYNEDNKLIEQAPGRPGDRPHLENFLDCIRTGKLPNADVEQGHQSTLLCHRANISWRVGNRKLAFDASTESFP